MVHFGCQLGARRAGPDDDDPDRMVGLMVAGVAEESVAKRAAQGQRLLGVVEKNAVLLHPRDAEIVGDAADGDDQEIESDASFGQQLVVIPIQCRGACRAVRRPGGPA